MKSISKTTALGAVFVAVCLLASASMVLAQAMCHADPATIAAVKAADAAEAARDAAATQPATAPSAAAPTTQGTANAKPVNTKCPVTGEDIDASITTVFDGKVIAFCCPDCVNTFKKNPKKYMADLK